MNDGQAPDAPEPQSGLDRFVSKYPKTAGFLGFLVAVLGGVVLTGLLAALASSISGNLAVTIRGLSGLVTLVLVVLIAIWGYRRGESAFLTGFFLPLGILVVLVGACIALLVRAFNAA